MIAQKRVCANCPWRRDAPPGEFTTERYRDLAECAKDQAQVLFACHKTEEGREAVCAGFLERGADHNFAVRLAYAFRDLERIDRTGGVDLYDDYREMAIANGVDPADPALWGCR